MVNRTIIDPMEQMRDFDFVMFEHDVMVGLGNLANDIFSQIGTQTIVAGLVASQTLAPSLTVAIGPGRIYQVAPGDAVAIGSIPQDLVTIVQQGQNVGQNLTFIPPAAGQSQWNLIQAQFSQVDAVRANDPNGGIVPFYNAANPTQPTSNSINTIRQGLCVLQVITGSAATTGSEVPPTASLGWVPLYLIDLVGGQTQITTSQVIPTGPSIGTNVPSSYAIAPFLTGLLASHHGGVPGQGPKVKLTNAQEVQGVLPYANMSAVRILLNASLTLYVNVSTGSDTNTGLSASAPFQTIQGAVNSIYHAYDFNGFGATISVANGTYNQSVTIQGLPVGFGTTYLQIIGNVAAPGSCILNAINANGFDGTFGSNVYVSGFTVLASGALGGQGSALYANNGAVISFSSIIFGVCGTAHIFGQAGGQIFGTNTYTITGSAPTHLEADASGITSIINCAVTLTGTPGFSTAFVIAGRGGSVQAAGATFNGSATGSRYDALLNGIINTGLNGANLTYFPGNAVGNTTSGGQYL